MKSFVFASVAAILGLIVTFSSCTKSSLTDPITTSHNTSASGTTSQLYSACIPSNYNELSSIVNGDTIRIWKVGMWHNNILNLYLNNYAAPIGCSLDNFYYIDSCIATMTFSDSIDLMQYIDFNSNVSQWLQFSCSSSVDSFLEVVVQQIRNNISGLDSFSVEERNLMLEILDYGQHGFASLSEKEDLIDHWTAISNKKFDGLFSGTMISILLYSECFWQEYLAEQGGSRLLNLALLDCAGGTISWFNDIISGHANGNNANPNAGIQYLKRAGMNALRTSAGPFGVLF